MYLTDILGKPSVLTKAGKIFASAFSDREIDVVMTVATKGIPLAYAVASYLDVPTVVVRKDNKVTEGSTMSITMCPDHPTAFRRCLLQNEACRRARTF